MLLSELGAVNIALQMLGEAPVVALNSTPSSVAAESVRIEVTREILTEGWRFNLERDVDITPAVDNTVTFIDVVSVTGERYGRDYVLRGNRLFDVEKGAYDKFTGTFKVDLARELVWADIPEAARVYIARRAGRVLQDRLMKDRLRSQLARQEEKEARIVLEKEEARGEPFTFLETDPQFRILRRP